MFPRTAVALVVLASLASACGSRTQARSNESQATSETASVRQPQDTAFRGTTTPVQRIRSLRPGVARPVLHEVRTAPGPSAGYDRVVFEFMGDSVPGYHVQYTTGPVQRCGSGDPVAVAGTGRLLIRFEPAQAHDEQGNPTPPIVERHRAPGLAAVRDLTLICDFEGQVEWVLGISSSLPYRVSELTGPARLVLDVGHKN